MPVYNAADYVPEAIESILSQTLRDFEFIIVDDGSNDGSKEICERYAADDSRIRLIHQRQNKGNYPSRNAGLAAARGEFVAVMDSDDIALPERLQHQVQFLQTHPDHTMVGSQVLLIDPEGAPIGSKGGLFSEHEAIDAALMARKWAVVHPAVTMRTSAVRAIGGYRDKYRTCADHDMYLRLAEQGRIANLQKVLLLYRQHYSSLTRLQSDQQKNLRLIQLEARERRNLTPIDDDQIPPIKEAKVLQRRQKMLLRYRWAVMALNEGYFRSGMKNLGYSFTLDPLGAAAVTFRRLGGRLKRQ